MCMCVCVCVCARVCVCVCLCLCLCFATSCSVPTLLFACSYGGRGVKFPARQIPSRLDT